MVARVARVARAEVREGINGTDLVSNNTNLLLSLCKDAGMQS
jgi:hypothetical protein